MKNGIFLDCRWPKWRRGQGESTSWIDLAYRHPARGLMMPRLRRKRQAAIKTSGGVYDTTALTDPTPIKDHPRFRLDCLATGSDAPYDDDETKTPSKPRRATQPLPVGLCPMSPKNGR